MTMPDKSNIDQQITSIFITIENYGTNSEARIDIKSLIKSELESIELPEKKNIHYVDGYKGNRINEARAEGFNECRGQVQAAIDKKMKELV